MGKNLVGTKRLEHEHKKLNSLIDRMQVGPGADPLDLAAPKRERLKLKEELEQQQAQQPAASQKQLS